MCLACRVFAHGEVSCKRCDVVCSVRVGGDRDAVVHLFPSMWGKGEHDERAGEKRAAWDREAAVVCPVTARAGRQAARVSSPTSGSVGGYGRPGDARMTGAMKLCGGAPVNANSAVQESDKGQKQSRCSKRPHHQGLVAIPRLSTTDPKHAQGAPASPQAPHRRHNLQEQRPCKKTRQAHHVGKTPDSEARNEEHPGQEQERSKHVQSTCFRLHRSRSACAIPQTKRGSS